ncbi:MAG: Na+/H+ antiporter subunit E [Clostridium sp.]|nr:Na+/H+ antiporter subunit E [Clostridium sp.]MCM1399268.1 Na+/H+ antiporter subunit E [Clostridium sp.]MCM1459756.1 Na+/H+ antiporter subunit E [Bacteroides sp.]
MLLLLFLAWIVFNANITLEIAIFGVVITLVIFVFLCKYMDYSLKKELSFYRLLPLIIAYFFILMWEIIKANFAMMRLVVLDKYENEPMIVKFQTDLKDDTCKAVLANSITLTPGTITVDVQENVYTVHCFDKDMADGMEDSVFVSLLRKIEKIKNGGER